jgi:hypothetical protein
MTSLNRFLIIDATAESMASKVVTFQLSMRLAALEPQSRKFEDSLNQVGAAYLEMLDRLHLQVGAATMCALRRGALNVEFIEQMPLLSIPAGLNPRADYVQQITEGTYAVMRKHGGENKQLFC